MKKISDFVNIDKVHLGLQISLIEAEDEMVHQMNHAKPVVDLIIEQCETDEALRGAIVATKILTDVIMSTIMQADGAGLLEQKINAVYNFATTYMPIISLSIITSPEVFQAVQREKNAS